MRRITPFVGNSRHAAFTLVEMVVVISLTALLTTVGAVLTGRLMQADLAGQEELAVQLTIDRLAQQWRADAHAAVWATRAGDGDIELRLVDGGRSRWTVQETTVVRESDGTGVPRRERFELLQGETRLHVRPDGRMIELVHRRPHGTYIESPADADRPQGREIHIVAAVGVAAQLRSAPARQHTMHQESNGAPLPTGNAALAASPQE